MAASVEIHPIDSGSCALENLADEARDQGFSFVDRLVQDARNGDNRFDKAGEVFCAAYCDERLVGCGGVNKDPYTDKHIGRLRHVYVLSGYRRTGIASVLVHDLLNRARPHFDALRLRTPGGGADSFYETLGFLPLEEPDATHIFRMRSQK